MPLSDRFRCFARVHKRLQGIYHAFMQQPIRLCNEWSSVRSGMPEMLLNAIPLVFRDQ